MIAPPTTLPELTQLITDKVQESLHLDYKQSRAINNPRNHKDIPKDVSAFANSDGGVIVYGVAEKEHLPIAVDEGVDHASFTRERLEQIILSNTSPRLSNLKIFQIPLSASASAYCVEIQKSYRGPHQDRESRR